MKKSIVMILCILMLLPLGCAGKNDAEEPAARLCFDYHYNATGALGTATYIMETDDAVFYLYNNTLYFSDKEYKDFMPLCAKPNCDHCGADCDALIEPIGGFWIYDKYIYYASYGHDAGDTDEAGIKTASLCRMRLDGSQHEEVMRFEPVDFGFTPRSTTCGFSYYGKYVTVTRTSYRNEMHTEYSMASGLVDLDGPSYTEYKRKEHREGDEEPESLAGIILAQDKELLYELNFINVSYEDPKGEPRLTSYNIETGEYTLLAELSKQPDYIDGAFMVNGGKFVYLSWDGTTKELHSVDLETGVDTLTASGSRDELKISYFDWKNGLLCGKYVDPDRDPAKSEFCVYDTDLGLIDSFTYEGLPEEVMGLSVFLQTESYLFAADGRNGISCCFAMPTWYIDKNDIGTGELTWRRWAPEG